MKANELMIGDWVECVYSTHKKKVYAQIDAIEEGQTCILVRLDNCNWFLDISFIKPTALTTEILEKNGFEKVFDEDGTECYCCYNCAADGYIKISLYNGGDGDWRIEIVNYEKFDDNKIVYSNNFIFLKVHQLQHALKLCGIEKGIIL